MFSQTIYAVRSEHFGPRFIRRRFHSFALCGLAAVTVTKSEPLNMPVGIRRGSGHPVWCLLVFHRSSGSAAPSKG